MIGPDQTGAMLEGAPNSIQTWKSFLSTWLGTQPRGRPSYTIQVICLPNGETRRAIYELFTRSGWRGVTFHEKSGTCWVSVQSPLLAQETEPTE